LSKPNTSSVIEKSFRLPDGNLVSIGKECFQVPEALFNPSLLPIEMDYGGNISIHEMLYNSIKKFDIDTRKDLYANIVLSGENSMYPGWSERVQKEIKGVAPKQVEIQVFAPPERKYSVWVGLVGRFSH